MHHPIRRTKQTLTLFMLVLSFQNSSALRKLIYTTCSQQGQAGHYPLPAHILNNTAKLKIEYHKRTILLFLISQRFLVNAEAVLVQLPHEGTAGTSQGPFTLADKQDFQASLLLMILD